MPDITEFVPVPSTADTPSVFRIGSLVFVALLISLAPAVGFLPSDWTKGLLATGISLLVVALLFGIKGAIANRHLQQISALFVAFAEREDVPVVISNGYGDILAANVLAEKKLGAVRGETLARCLRSKFANPSAILLSLQSRAQSAGRAQSEFPGGDRTISVSVHQLRPGLFCWSFSCVQQESWQTLGLPVVTLGREGDVLRVNATAERLFGAHPAGAQDIFSEAEPRIGAVNAVRTRDGHVLAAVSVLSQSGSERSLCVLPITQRPAQDAVTSFSDLPVPILRLSEDGIILDSNRLAVKLLGKKQLEGSNISDIMRGMGGPALDWLKRTEAHEETLRSEFLRFIRDDKEIFVQVTLSRVFVDGKICLIAVLNDATELKTLEAQFVQGQKMQAVGQLAGGVAHDFNNLLTAISGHCDLLLLRHDQNDPDYGDLVQINQNANRAAALVSQLLAFSRKQTLRPEVLDLRDTISDLIHLLNRLVGEKVQLTLSHDPVLKPVRADKRQLEQVLMNLVVNARDAMPDGGEIRIETSVLTLSQPLMRDRATVQPGDYVAVKVVDSGVGIPADKLQKIFEPFYTTKRTGEGTGLGLSTAYGDRQANRRVHICRQCD
ncbi:ATP-binding protein [Ruegeria sp. HKCCSP351]|uniref:two-component system sensor histidine kinase NtrB n=1 Tax=Ruegeria sp. HKCCSP351 TaxID=2794832 RepID=UPI0032AEC77C